MSTDRYLTPSDMPDWNLRMRICRDCGSLVSDTNQHDRFHDKIDRASSRAASLGPIG